MIGTNKDILVYPAVYNGINTGITITNDNGQTSQTNTTPVQTEAPAPVPAPVEETTVEQTEEATTAAATEPETETETEAETVTEAETETETESAARTDDAIKSKTFPKGLLITAVAILLAGVIAAIIFVIRRKRNNINE